MAEHLRGVFWVCLAAVLSALSLAYAADDTAQGSDFLVLAIKPEGDVKDYRMVPVGEQAVDHVQYRDVVNSMPRSLFGGVIVRPHDERAELAQCRTACAANAKCGNFTYVRPGKDRPIGVCHLRRVAEKPADVAVEKPNYADTPVTIAMAPVVENEAPKPEVVFVSPAVRNEHKLINVDSRRNGRSLFAGEQSPGAPITFRFNEPVATAKAEVRATGKDRVWANIEALDVNGRVFKRSGTWIASDGDAHQVLVRTESDRIGAVRITTRDPGAVRVDGIDFVRAAPTLAEATPVETAEAIDAAEADIPPPEPEFTAEAFPLPARAQARMQTKDVAESAPPPQDQPVEQAPTQHVTVAELPADGSQDATITIPIAPAEAQPVEAQPVEAVPTAIAETTTHPLQQPPELPLLAAAGAAVFLLGGAGLYRHNYRRRTLARLTTNILTDGRSRPTVSLTTDEPDMSLRFAVRAHATVSARQTTITITPDGAAA